MWKKTNLKAIDCIAKDSIIPNFRLLTWCLKGLVGKPYCSPHVLVSLDCPNKMPQAGWLMNSRNLLLTVLEVGSLRSRCWQILVHRRHIPAVFLHMKEANDLSGDFFIRHQSQSRELHNGDLTYPKCCTPNTVILDIRIQHMSFGKTQIFLYSILIQKFFRQA